MMPGWANHIEPTGGTQRRGLCGGGAGIVKFILRFLPSLRSRYRRVMTSNTALELLHIPSSAEDGTACKPLYNSFRLIPAYSEAR